MKIGIAIGAATVVAALLVSLVPIRDVAYAVTVDYEDTETYYENEPLEYRQLDSFTTEAMDDVRGRAAMVGYNLPGEIVEWPSFAVYVVVQNLGDIPGVFEVCYTCVGTADRAVAEDRQLWVQSTPEEYEELLDIDCCQGTVELQLRPLEVGVAICPQGGVPVGSDRVAWWSGGYDIIPGTQAVQSERTVTKHRQETRYKKVTLLDYLLYYR
jgi:hypothetical protein